MNFSRDMRAMYQNIVIVISLFCVRQKRAPSEQERLPKRKKFVQIQQKKAQEQYQRFPILNFFEILAYSYFKHPRCFRSSRPEVFCKKRVLRNFVKLTGKHLYQSLFFNKIASSVFIQKSMFSLLLAGNNPEQISVR